MWWGSVIICMKKISYSNDEGQTAHCVVIGCMTTQCKNAGEGVAHLHKYQILFTQNISKMTLNSSKIGGCDPADYLNTFSLL